MSKTLSICDSMQTYGETAALLASHEDADALVDYFMMVLVGMVVNTSHLYAQPIVPHQPIKG